MSLPYLRPVKDGVEVCIFVQPRASRNKLVGQQGEELKVALTAPPVDGAANKACCVFFAKLCGLPKSRVAIAAGESSRHKRLLLQGLELESAADLLRKSVKT